MVRLRKEGHFVQISFRITFSGATEPFIEELSSTLIYDEVCRIIKRSWLPDVYEPSNAPYRTRWFCVLKKDRGFEAMTESGTSECNYYSTFGVPPIPDHMVGQLQDIHAVQLWTICGIMMKD